MPKKTSKTSTKKTSTKKTSAQLVSHGVRPSVGIIFTLVIALIVTITISVVSINQLKAANSALSAEKLAIFEHLAEGYVNDMDFVADNKPTMKQLTGYGVSDEDGVFYMTFDFVPYDVVDNNYVPDGDTRHGIMYFWEDKERGTYSHAFSYHDDASYHPAGVYVELEQ